MKLMKVTDPQVVMKIIAENFPALDITELPLEQAGGYCLAEDLEAPEDVPGFTRSTVDGYAVKASDTFGASESIPAMLDCVGEVMMGREAPAIKEGQCCLLHTGGMLPEGSNAVVMVEDSDTNGSMIQLFRQVAPAENVIQRGEDLKTGDTALAVGHKLRAPEIGLLASLGIAAVNVTRRPLVGFFSSGDELVDYRNNTLQPGQIRDSNAPALLYLAEQYGADVKYGGILPDRFETFMEKSRTMLEEADLLVFSGGSSVGSRDYTARTMQELGKPGLLVEGISIQPGKPTLLANCGGKPVLGLPGHPVSALNIFAIFGKAIIDSLAGRSKQHLKPTVKARLSRNISSRSGRTDYVRIKLEQTANGFEAHPVFGRSGMLRTLAEADGLLIVPAANEGLNAGEAVEVSIWE